MKSRISVSFLALGLALALPGLKRAAAQEGETSEAVVVDVERLVA